MRRASIITLCGAALALTANPSWGGSLDPPSPPASTHPTLAEVEARTPLTDANTPGDAEAVFVISQPGSYYLTGNLSPTDGKSGIRITADHVTVDLNGFTVDGSGATSDFPSGVHTEGSRRGLTLRNGSIRGFAGYGVSGLWHGSLFEDLAVLENASGQLEVPQSDGTIARGVRSEAASGELGIGLGANALVEDCVVAGSHTGIAIASGAVSRCTVTGSVSTGIEIVAGLVIDCAVSGVSTASSFRSGGITAGTGTRVERCVIRGCAVPGVYIGGECDIVGNQFSSCVIGVGGSAFENVPARIERNTFLQCTTSAISLPNPGSLVAGNRFHANTAHVTAAAGNIIGELLDLTAGSASASSSNTLANIVH